MMSFEQVFLQRTLGTIFEQYLPQSLGIGEFGSLMQHQNTPFAHGWPSKIAFQQGTVWLGGIWESRRFVGSVTRDHLFFSCGYSCTIWAGLAKNIFKSRYSTDWNTIIAYVSVHRSSKMLLLARYVLQATVYSIWRERNGRRHGATPNTENRIIRWIDKQVRNRLATIIALGDKRYDNCLQLWFQARS